ncbi:MAG: hypothetical protein EXS05_00470 [Planctomycetaceae bacterium]|nr:hypothetical protein [Planctomycetaceae bacterium]
MMRVSKRMTALLLCSVVLPAVARAQAERVIGPARNVAPEAARILQLIGPPPADVVRTRTLEWVAQRAAGDPARLEQIGKLWGLGDEQPSPEQLFELAIRSFGLADPATQAFIESCALQRPALTAPEAQVLEVADAGLFYRSNLGLFFGRYLVQRQMFEEGLTVLEQVPVGDVVDPAGFLFYKAVCQHHLLLKSDGLATIEQLLKATEGVPVRYTTVATLMQYDLEALQDKSLDEISRKMSDVERRLNLGRTGQKVQKKEDEIIATFDEIIKKIEDQQGGGGGGAGGQSNRSNSPANDSVVKGSTAPGTVDNKKLKNGAEWGDLPPKARARAKDLISREFPAHYRAAIEEFTRKGASRSASSGK